MNHTSHIQSGPDVILVLLHLRGVQTICLVVTPGGQGKVLHSRQLRKLQMRWGNASTFKTTICNGIAEWQCSKMLTSVTKMHRLKEQYRVAKQIGKDRGHLDGIREERMQVKKISINTGEQKLIKALIG